MKALLLGSGGRESALAWALARSHTIDELVVAPGNPGIERIATTRAIDPAAPDEVVRLADEIDAGLIVVGPEAPLVAGVADVLRDKGRNVFGPDSAAAQIEGSKSFAKDLMNRAGIPTAEARTVRSMDEASAVIDEFGSPFVIKADGLAAGKGVTVTSDRDEALSALENCLVKDSFGEAGRRVVIERFLDGQEASVIAFTDGTAVVPCEPAQDYKRVFDADEGPNTGGMGSYSPVPACPPRLAESIRAEILEPMVRELDRRGTPFIGALYAGLALTSEGPRVIEFNARFGDPETQALIPRLDSDFGELALASAGGELEGVDIRWSRKACVAVVLASGGYPGSHSTGHEITGLDSLPGDVHVFHAGTKRDGDRILTAGGRVLAVSALGDNHGDARGRAYAAAERIDFEGKHIRSDIALRAENS
jgi:phosphoribosylamine---glycine ligase